MVGAIASGINAVAGGGSLISFPVLSLTLGLPEKVANATNAVALWPGSLTGGLGFAGQLERTKHAFKTLIIPTLFGSALGSYLLLVTSAGAFRKIVPFLVLFAALILLVQPTVKKWISGPHGHLPGYAGVVLQFLVALYGGYFGAGMGIMMLACFALYIEGTIHELNAVKNWLGLAINFAASVIFIAQGLVLPGPAICLTIGSLIGGYLAAKVSLRFDPEKLRPAIAIYGVVMSGYFFYRAFA